MKDRNQRENADETRCRDFDRGYCPRGSTCRYNHRKDRLSTLPHQTNRQHQQRTRFLSATERGRQTEQNHQQPQNPMETRRD